MYWGENEHPPPHFHALRAEEVMVVNIRDLDVRKSNASASTERKVLDWAKDHQLELLANWNRLQQHQPPKPIEP